MILNKDIKNYLDHLVKKFPQIEAVWLIGSRANSYAKTDSDWDFLVFGNDNILQSLRSNSSFKQNNIDLLIVHNGNTFIEPWGKNQKHGTLVDWEWKQTSPNDSEYISHNWIPNENDTKRFGVKHNAEFGTIVDRKSKGILVWEKTMGFI